MQNEGNYLYSKSVLDFVRTATEYCKYLEQAQETERNDFCRVMRGLLPMLYMGVTMLHDLPEAAGWNESCVTEADYNYIRATVARIMAEADDFLDVFVEDFKYSEQPVLATVSENLADVYQALRELVEAFRKGYEEAMEVALCDAVAEFEMSWGQKLLGALRAIHDVTFKN